MALAQIELKRMLQDGTRVYDLSIMDEYELTPLRFRFSLFEGEACLVESVETVEDDIDPELKIARRG